MEDQIYLTRAEAALLLRTTPKQLGRLTAKGEIKAKKVGGRYLYKKEDLL